MPVALRVGNVGEGTLSGREYCRKREAAYLLYAQACISAAAMILFKISPAMSTYSKYCTVSVLTVQY